MRLAQTPQLRQLLGKAAEDEGMLEVKLLVAAGHAALQKPEMLLSDTLRTGPSNRCRNLVQRGHTGMEEALSSILSHQVHVCPRQKSPWMRAWTPVPAPSAWLQRGLEGQIFQDHGPKYQSSSMELGAQGSCSRLLQRVSGPWLAGNATLVSLAGPGYTWLVKAEACSCLLL